MSPQIQIVVDGVELNRRFLNSPFPLVSEVTKAFAKGKIQAFLPLNSFGRILIRITMHSVPKHEIWFKKFLDSMFNFAHYINPDKKCFKKLILRASTNFYFYVTVCTQCSIVCSMSIEFEVGRYQVAANLLHFGEKARNVKNQHHFYELFKV